MKELGVALRRLAARLFVWVGIVAVVALGPGAADARFGGGGFGGGGFRGGGVGGGGFGGFHGGGFGGGGFGGSRFGDGGGFDRGGDFRFRRRWLRQCP